MPKQSHFNVNEKGRCFHLLVCLSAEKPGGAGKPPPRPAALLQVVRDSGARYLCGSGSSARSASSCPSPEEGGKPRPTSQEPLDRLLQGRGSGGSAVA